MVSQSLVHAEINWPETIHNESIFNINWANSGSLLTDE